MYRASDENRASNPILAAGIIFFILCVAQGLEESEGRISALISKVKTLEGVNTDLNKKITNLDRRGKEQETMHKKQVLTTTPFCYYNVFNRALCRTGRDDPRIVPPTGLNLG